MKRAAFAPSITRWSYESDIGSINRGTNSVPSQTGLVAERITAIARAAGQIIVNQSPIAAHQGQGDLLNLIGSKRFDRGIEKNGFEHAEVFDLKRVTDGEVEIGNAIIRL